MPKILKTEKVVVEKSVDAGFVCDRCEEVIDKQNCLRTDNFEINYTFGYGTKYDCTQVSATICDNCLIDIIVKEVPNAKIGELPW